MEGNGRDVLHVRWNVARGEHKGGVFRARYELGVGNIVRLVWVVFKGLIVLGTSALRVITTCCMLTAFVACVLGWLLPGEI